MPLTQVPSSMLNSVFPSVQRFTSGTGTYYPTYAFYTSGANATINATYTNNGVTFTVISTVASSNVVYCWGNSAPTASGTLTKATGTGDSSITFSGYLTPRYINVSMVGGGGGGGGGSGSSNGNPGTATTFGGYTAGFGSGGGSVGGGSQGAGGTNTLGTGATVLVNITGASGNGAGTNGGGMGGVSQFGGAGSGGCGPTGASNGTSAAANSGSGGGGGGSSASSGGGGGGAGGYLKLMIYSPSATYSYQIGNGGALVTNSGAGGTGVIIVEEYYQ